MQGRREEDDVVEKLNLFLDLLQSYKVSVLSSPRGKNGISNDVQLECAEKWSRRLWKPVDIFVFFVMVLQMCF